MNKEKIRNCDIPEEIKDICRSCESNIFAQNKGCAFRSLGNEYCDYVENATRKYLDLQKKAELGDHYKHLYSEVKKQKDDLQKEMDYVDDYNRHLLKQKDDVVEYIKNETEELENKIDDYAISKYVKRDLLRMLGEIDE